MTLPVVGPVRVTVTVTELLPLLPSALETSAIEIIGPTGVSLSAIVPVWLDGEPTVYPLPVATVRMTVSELSTAVSFTGVTVTVALAEPAAIVNTEPDSDPPVTETV